MQGIYKIINKTNGKYYVGSSMDLQRRWKRHKKNLIGNYHVNKKLLNAWKKYGEKSFDFVVVIELPTMVKSEILEVEQRYLDVASKEKDNCYNISFKNRGWGLSIEKLKQSLPRGCKHKDYNHEIFTFENISTNEIFSGTRHDLYSKYKLIKNNVRELIQGKRKTVRGWKLKID